MKLAERAATTFALKGNLNIRKRKKLDGLIEDITTLSFCIFNERMDADFIELLSKETKNDEVSDETLIKEVQDLKKTISTLESKLSALNDLLVNKLPAFEKCFVENQQLTSKLKNSFQFKYFNFNERGETESSSDNFFGEENRLNLHPTEGFKISYPYFQEK